ncbi:hypothetical protein [Rhizobium etli]|uniref:hypothetical protein n=1 Tax=Rhizobium etli TaxID=29449 RepID=UPI0012DB518C|nr:hypothetical protein [Rhizobium etli]
MAEEQNGLRRFFRKVKDVFNRKDKPETGRDRPLPPLPTAPRQRHPAAKEITPDQIGPPKGEISRTDFLRPIDGTPPPRLPTAAINSPPASLTYASDLPRPLHGGLDDPSRVSPIVESFREAHGSDRSSDFSQSASAQQPAGNETSRFSAWSTNSGLSDVATAHDDMFDGLDENPLKRRSSVAEHRDVSPRWGASSSTLSPVTDSLSGSTLGTSPSIDGLQTPDAVAGEGYFGEIPIYLDPASQEQAQADSRKIVRLRKPSREEIKLVTVSGSESAPQSPRSAASTGTQPLRQDVSRAPTPTDETANRGLDILLPRTYSPPSRSPRSRSDIEQDLVAAHTGDRDRTSRDR